MSQTAEQAAEAAIAEALEAEQAAEAKAAEAGAKEKQDADDREAGGGGDRYDQMTDEAAEAEAREQGWNPDYSGANRRDAREYLRAGERIDYRKQIKGLRHDIEETRREAAQTQRDAKQARDLMAKQLQERHEREIAAIRAERTAAFEAGDAKAFDKADQKLDEAKSAKPELEQETAGDPYGDAPAELSKFEARPEMRQDDPEMAALAEGFRMNLARGMQKDNKFLPYAELHDKVGEMLLSSAAYKAKYGRKEQRAASVEGNQRGRARKAKTYDAMPDEFRRAADEQEELYKGGRDDYVKAFYEEYGDE